MKDFDTYFEEIIDKTEDCQIPKATDNTFFIKCGRETDSKYKVEAKKSGPYELCLIKLFIDDYEEIDEHELIAECEGEITLTDKLGKWSVTYTGEKLYFYKQTDENIVSAFILKIIE